MGRKDILSCAVLAAATVLSVLLAGCTDAPAGGATAKPAPKVTPASPGEPISAPLAAETPKETPKETPTEKSTEKPTVPVVPANFTGSAPVQVAADKGPADKIRDITFDTIKFPMEKTDTFKRSMLTPQIEALTGQPVRIRGYILPSFKQHGLTQFVLVRDNLSCCFGPGAALYDCVIVEMEPGKATEFSIRPVAVEGVFNVNILPGPTDRPLAIYHLRGTSVK